MITEHALLPVIPGREIEFELAFADARAIISSMPGCRSLTLSRSIESPSTYLLLVEWCRPSRYLTVAASSSVTMSGCEKAPPV
ncbi:antibiotic biosynthesis monooxygenase family protein, partial [Cryobacterium sp. RTS3]|uniref:antibiotic biosynthesis monooxygenase family protein n=1 Tax=Cryobacterium sp. RTS3 TaxID=3048643 RepID=UPI002B224791